MTRSIVVSNPAYHAETGVRPLSHPPPDSHWEPTLTRIRANEFEVVGPGNGVAKDHGNTDPPRGGGRPNDREAWTGRSRAVCRGTRETGVAPGSRVRNYSGVDDQKYHVRRSKVKSRGAACLRLTSASTPLLS